MSTQLAGPGQNLADEVGKAVPAHVRQPGRTVRARTLLTKEECAMVEEMEAKSGKPVFVHFRMLDTSMEARLDGCIPDGAVAQRGQNGLVTGQVIVGG